MRLLFVLAKTIDPLAKECSIEAPENYWVIGSLPADLATAETCYWDEHLRNGISPEKYILDYNADIVVFSGQPTAYASGVFAIAYVLKELQRLGIPTVHILWDQISPHNQEIMRKLSPFLTLNAVTDVLEAKEKFGDNYINIWYPVDPLLIFPRKKDIDVSFMGTLVPQMGQRGRYLKFLQSQDVPVFFRPGVYTENQPLSTKEYADILGRSKIGLNFSHMEEYQHHTIKGRIFEVIRSGSLLLETENNTTSTYFEPGVDYVSFSNEADLLDKIRYYLSHEEEREAIAAHGYAKACEHYNEEKFWQRIFTAVSRPRSRPS